MNRLAVRLSIAFLLVAWLAVGAMAFVVQRTVETGFQRYVYQREVSLLSEDETDRLVTYYAENGSWDGVTLTSMRGGGGGQRGRGATTVLTDAAGNVVASTGDERVGMHMGDDALSAAAPLTLDGQTIGWLARQTPGMEHMGVTETVFLDTANQTLLITALAVSVVALVVGIALAWLLSRPLHTLTTAVRSIGPGQFGRQVALAGTVETASLALAFNELSTQLADADSSRQRMAADIAHELRTPVSVLRGQLEAMRDGVFPADQVHLAVAHDQTLHLGRLVDDLRLLTLAEAGQIALTRQPALPAALVQEAVSRFLLLAQDAGVEIRSDVHPSLPALLLDSARIRQVFDNLLSNALRHTTAGGEIVVTAQQRAGEVVFSVANSGQVSPIAAEHMLDRFWRADDARQRDSGGSGLGLPIARQLVALHGGRLWVETTPTQVVLAFSVPA